MVSSPLPKALYEAPLSHPVIPGYAITKQEADRLFSFFQNHSLFRWGDAKNDCEDRAHAICLLLESWKIPAYKGWVFSGAYLKKTTGSLVNFWNYHVAAALPVWEGSGITIYMIDPSTANHLISIHDWATLITEDECSYYLIRKSEDYIFNQTVIKPDNWYKTNRQNYKWTIQGLAGINGVTASGKAQVIFNKTRIIKTEKAFKKLLGSNPVQSMKDHA
ncbi:MAG TPA: protein-glutamine glutaminase family protein [Flavisolibacter sp.]|nr:protein-glutamine glutaminase family protein [Flavisolibacter sp.]